jgi:glutamate-1-semialdehyde 2,1-aminomutase
MAASLATLKELQAAGGIERMRTIGEMLRAGLIDQARGAGLEVLYSGPPAIPYMTFVADAGHFDRAKVFCGECSRHGVYFAPRHNWFLSAAHTERDIQQTLNVTELAFKVVREQFGA